MLRLAADRVALGIERARVYEREHRIAETLQRSLLPDRLPELPGPGGGRPLPARGGRGRGGRRLVRRDLDPRRRGRARDGRHRRQGAGGRLDGRAVAGALRAYALEGHPPERVVEQLNRLRLDRARREPDGHAALRRARPGRRRGALGERRPPAAADGRWQRAPCRTSSRAAARFRSGCMPFPKFEEVALSLEPGGTVVLYTDGLVERPGENIDEGLGRLAAALRDAPRGPGAALRPPAANARAGGRGRSTTWRCWHCATSRWPTASAWSSPPIRRRSSPCAGCCAAGCAMPDGSDQEIAEITTACGEAATNAIEHAGASGSMPVRGAGKPGGQRHEHHRARLWRLALAARGRPGPRPVADAGAHGRGGRLADARGHDGAHAAKAQREAGREHERRAGHAGGRGARRDRDRAPWPASSTSPMAPAMGDEIAAAVPTSARAPGGGLHAARRSSTRAASPCCSRLPAGLSSRRQELSVVAPGGEGVARVLELVEFSRAAPIHQDLDSALAELG